MKWIDRIRGKSAELSPREREAERLREEVRMASMFATFMCEAHSRGYSAKLTIEVDGVGCETGLLLSAKEPLMEYLANWACGQMYKKAGRLMEFEKIPPGGWPSDQDFDKLMKRIQESQDKAKGIDWSFLRTKGVGKKEGKE